MTFLYGTNVELLYSLPAVGATQSSSVATVLNTAATSPPFQLPALQNIWSPSSIVGKGIMIVACGGCSTATNTLTTLKLALDGTVGTSGIVVASTGALPAAGVAASAAAWEAQCWLTCTGVTSNTSSTWFAQGQFQIAASNAVTAASFAWGNTITNGVPQSVTIPMQTPLFVDLYAQWQISPGAMVCSQFLVFGLN